MNNQNISADFPFESKYLEVLGSKMHYIDIGQGEPILFLHGNPTSSYLWRNIIPYLTKDTRCIAVDLIGMGKSDKPNIGYSFKEHYQYIEKFIEQLGLKNITLVIHDWGSALGFNYAYNHQSNVKGIVFMESMYKPFNWADMPLGLKAVFKLMRAPFIGWLMLSVGNFFLNKMLPSMIRRKLSQAEYSYYKMPFKTIASRKPVRVWPQQIPFDGKPEYNAKIVSVYGIWLTKSELPKLCIYSHPGVLIQKSDVEYIRNHFKNTTVVDVGEGLHFIQEDNPQKIGEAIAKWYKEIN